MDYINDTIDYWYNMSESPIPATLSNTTSLLPSLTNHKQPSSPNWRIIFGITVFITAIIGNAILMGVILLNRQLRKLEHVPIASLCVVNILTAVMIILPFFTFIIHRQWTLGPAMCFLWNPMGYFLPSTGIFHYTIISIDRYLRVTQPLNVMKIKTKRILVLLLILSWVIPAIISYIPEIFWRRFDFSNPNRCYYKYHKKNMLIYNSLVIAVLFCLPLILTTVIYVKLTRIALNHSRIIKQQRQSITSQQLKDKKKIKRLSKQSKGELILAFLLLTFVICWLPTLIYALISSITFPKHPSIKIPWLYPTLLVINFCYPTVNPIMFGLLYRPVRTALMKQCCKCGRSKGRGIIEQTNATIVNSLSRSSMAIKTSNSLNSSHDRRLFRHFRSSNSHFNPSDTLNSIKDYKKRQSSFKQIISRHQSSSSVLCSPMDIAFQPSPMAMMDKPHLYISDNFVNNHNYGVKASRKKAYKYSHSSSTTSSSNLQCIDFSDNVFHDHPNQVTNV